MTSMPLSIRLLLLVTLCAPALSGCLVYTVEDDDDSVANDDDSVANDDDAVDDDDSVDDDDATEPPFPNPSLAYRLQTQERGKWDCLESGDGNFGSFMTLCGPYSGQAWRFEAVPDDPERYVLHSEFQPDKCLDAGDSTGTVFDGAAFMAECSGDANQQWELEPQGEWYRLTSVGRQGDCLDGNVSGGPEVNGNTFSNSCSSSGRQRWRLVDMNLPLPYGLSGHEVVSSTASHPGAWSAHATACPSGKVVVGGGGFWSLGLNLTASQPAGVTNWEFEGQAPTGEEWGVTAVCADLDSLPGYAIYENTGSHLNGGQWIEATCPPGHVVLGGGGRWDGTSISVDNSRPLSASSWGIAGTSETGGEWTAYAICALGAGVPGHEIVTTMGQHPGTGGQWIEAECPPGKLALSGGGYWNKDLIQLDNTVPIGDDGWALAGLSTATAAEWWAVAICAEFEDAR
ncbi:MAG: ricin-type beta-trefoil lectin domain protein [Deltaproteobacteria bacterium]|nr:ricin-type beta-trefoil lectin domain protein [Deltaproteobacteria bacterium]